MIMNSSGAAALLQQIGDHLSFIFGGDVPVEPMRLHQVAARALLVFVVGLAIVRIGKSRLISRNTSIDVILAFTLGSVLSRGITGNASLSGTFVASVVLVAAHWVLTWLACHSHTLGKLVKGNANVLVEDGKVVRENMISSHISDRDLEEGLRLSGVESVEDVRRAYKERNGEVSVIRRKPSCRVVEIAVREGVQTVRLEMS
jgi:uncharacterized membrane protein YcaP (DUF421 family)